MQTLTPLHRRVIDIIKAAGKEYGYDHAARLAAGLSYYTIFSLVPLLFLLVAIAGFVFSDPAAVTELIDQVTQVAGQEVGSIIGDLVATVTEQRGGALSIGLVLAAYSASGIFQQVQAVLGVVFHVPEKEKRSGVAGWLIRRGIALVSAVVLAVLAFIPIGAVAAVSSVVSLLPESISWVGPVLQLGVPLISVILLMALVGLTFQSLTVVEIPWKAAIRGGIATALVALGAAYVVGVYLSRFGSSGTLGALGGLAVLLFFFNLMWTVYLFGAEVTKVYADYLEYGDVFQPSVREHRRPTEPFRHMAEPASREHSNRSGLETGVLAFGVGLILGWFGRRRS